MRLKKLKLENYRQHRKICIDFPHAGLFGLIGENGSGKSNILSAIRLLLVGSIDEPLSSCLQWGSREGRAELEILLEDGGIAKISRTFTSSGEMFFMDLDGEKFKLTSKAYDRLHSRMNSSPDMLDKLVIATQGELGAFLFQTPAKRTEAFQRLFHSDSAERLRDDTQGEKELVLLHVTDQTADIARLKTTIAQIKDDINAKKQTKELLQNNPVDESLGGKEEEQRRIGLDFQHRSLLAQLNSKVAIVAAMETVLAADSASAVELEELIQTAKDIINLWNNQEIWRRLSSNIDKTESDLVIAKNALVNVDLPEEHAKLDNHRLHLQHLRTDISLGDSLRAATAVKDAELLEVCPVCQYRPTVVKGHCPLCNGPLPKDLVDVSQFKKEAEIAYSWIKSQEERLRRLDGASRDLVLAEQNLARLKSEWARHPELIDTVTAEKARKILPSLEKRLVSRADAERNIEQARAEQTLLQEQLDKVTASLKKINAALIRSYTAAVEAKAQQERNLARLIGELTGLDDQLKRAE